MTCASASTTSTGPLKMKFKFQVGDRVARRPRAELNVAASASAKKAFNLSTRQSLHGTVTGFTIKTNSRGATRKFIQVKWDDSSSVSEHEQMRLCFASELIAESNAARLHHE